MAKDAFYFSHDTNACQDEKIIKLLKTHGLEGLGLYWIMVEALHQQESGMLDKEAFEAIVFMYINTFSSKSEQMLSICSAFVEQKLFKVVNEKYTSDRVLRNKQHRQNVSKARRVAGKMSIASKRKSFSNNTLEQMPSNCQAIVEQLPNIQKKRKEKKIKYISTPIEQNAQSDVKVCIDYFFQKHQETTGNKYHVDGGKDGNIIKSLLLTFSKEEIFNKIDLFFRSPNDFIKEAGFTIGVFKSQINKLSSGKSTNLMQLEKLVQEGKQNATNRL